jgi:hypothetical protein
MNDTLNHGAKLLLVLEQLMAEYSDNAILKDLKKNLIKNLAEENLIATQKNIQDIDLVVAEIGNEITGKMKASAAEFQSR